MEDLKELARKVAASIKREEWRLECINEMAFKAEDERQAVIRYFRQRMETVQKAEKIFEQLVWMTRVKPASFFFGCGTTLFIRANDHRIVHDAAREFHVVFRKKPEGDSFQYSATINGVSLIIYGIPFDGKYKVKKKQRKRVITTEEEEYELVPFRS